MMHGPAANAIAIFLFGISGVMLMATGQAWVKVAKERERANEKPKLSVHGVRNAAGVTAATLFLLGLACIWLALILVP